jgi:plastocyanin
MITGGGATPTSSGGPGGCVSGTVQTNAANFVQPCVNIAKGTSVTIVPFGVSLQILANGSWVNGAAQPAQEPGAPTISNVQVTNASIEIGPFNVAGMFHLYYTVHVNMNLVVNVT